MSIQSFVTRGLMVGAAGLETLENWCLRIIGFSFISEFKLLYGCVVKL